MSMEKKNLQLTLNDEKIDEIIKNLEMIKKDNNKLLRIDGGKGKPGIIMMHSKFDKFKFFKEQLVKEKEQKEIKK